MKILVSRILLTVTAFSLVFTPALTQVAAGGQPLDSAYMEFEGETTANELHVLMKEVEALEAAASANRQDIPPAVQQIINQIFQAVSNIVIQYANQVNQWKNQALSAAQKTVEDFTGCPSNAAQNLYNDLKTKRANLQQVIADATAADNQARQARANCRNSVPNNNVFKTACDVAYNNLPFAGIKTAAQAALNAVNTAINVLKALKCVSGCNQTAKLVFPTVNVEPGPVLKGPSITVCTQWEPGQFSYNVDPGSGELSASVYAKLPKCKKTETFPLTGCDWDIKVLLPVLERLRLVPPGLDPGNVKINIPTRTVQVLSGFNQGACSQPLKVCKQININANITFDLGTDPITNLKNAMQNVASSCTQEVTVGCLSPPFGITPTYTRIRIPDPTRATISWTGARIRPGSVTVDLGKREFSLACKAKPLSIPGPPKISIGKQVINFPFLCLQPRVSNLVANQ